MLWSNLLRKYEWKLKCHHIILYHIVEKINVIIPKYCLTSATVIFASVASLSLSLRGGVEHLELGFVLSSS